MALQAYEAQPLMRSAKFDQTVIDKMIEDQSLRNKVFPLLEQILLLQMDRDATDLRPSEGVLKAEIGHARDTDKQREQILRQSPTMIRARWQVIREILQVSHVR